MTNRVNVLRGVGISALNARRTECSQGHEFTEANTYRRPGSDWRECKTCKREVSASRGTKVPCPTCGGLVSRRHMPRHLREVHSVDRQAS